MNVDRPYCVLLGTVAPARFDHLGRLLQGAGYHTLRDDAGTRGDAEADARVLDYVGSRSREDPSRTALHTVYDELTPVLMVMPERLSSEVRGDPQAMVHTDVQGGDQALLLRVALTCRRGRAIHDQVARLGLTLDSRSHTLRCGSGAATTLTPLEFRLLRAILRGGGETVPRRQLIDATWIDRVGVPGATLDSHVRGLRAKLVAAGVPLEIETDRGVGFACR